jgi:hypothetical protein
MIINKKYELLNALAEIRDNLRDAQQGKLSQHQCDCFNKLAKKLGTESEDWAIPLID